MIDIGGSDGGISFMNQWLHDKSGPLLVSAAAACWYIAVMIGTAGMTASRNLPGRRAFAAWLAILPIVIIAVLDGNFEIAVGMIFATSVASMTLVTGILTLAASNRNPVLSRRAWGMLLPSALICFLIGLSGGFRWIHAAFLVAEGIVVVLFWNEPVKETASNRVLPASAIKSMALLGLAIVFAIGGGWLAVQSARHISTNASLVSGGVVAALMLSPAMLLPMIGLGLHDVSENRYDQAISTQIGLVLFNLCGSLPLAIAIWLGRQWWQGDPMGSMPYPMSVWRVDTVMLIAAGFLFLPVSVGRWTLGKAEGAGMLLAYIVFMILTVLAALTGLL